ncbi:MAG TPA: pitrilysin family protein [Herpetosiphonaceae bacterium]
MSLTTNEFRLPNGLTVLTREVHSAPIATCWIWYRVGGRNERVGISGISHWCEHMLFKGTERMPKGAFDATIARNGGTFNGFTWIDYTAYYETLPSDRLRLGLQIEADRMVNSLFDPAEVASERTVIISEREGNENSPLFWLDEELRATAFKVHPYRNGVIGWKSDLRAMTREDLYSHYQTFYAPNNAVLVLVGDFNTESVMREVEELYGPIPAGPALPEVRGEEPEQQGERRVVVERPGASAYVQIAYHAPNARSADFAALTVLDAVLSGGKPPSFFGGGAQTNRSARLYRALVEGELAADASSSYMGTIDPYLFELSATVRPDRTPAQVEQALLAEVDKLRGEPISQSELEKVQRQMRAQFAYSTERITNQALTLGMWELLDRHTRLDTLLDDIAAVQPADVQRVAEQYFGPRSRTVGHFTPTAETGDGAKPGDPLGAAAFRPSFYTGVSFDHALGDGGALPEGEASRHVLPNGLVVLLQRNASSPTVSVAGEIGLGQIHEPAEKNGLAVFAAAALIRGTASRSFHDITDTTESLGCSVNASAGRHQTSFGGRALTEDSGLVLEILADMIRNPVFPEQEVERLRAQFATRLRQEAQDTRAVASRAVREALFPADHPYSRQPLGTPATIEAISREDLAAFAARYHPAATRIAVVGDIDPAAILAEIERWFGDWQGAGEPPSQAVPAVALPQSGQQRRLPVAGKTQSDIVWAVPGVARGDDRYYAAMLANLVLGQLGLMGRLGENVRDRLGLAYYAYSSLDADLGAGPWFIAAGVNPASIDKALGGIREEVERLLNEGITEEERSDSVAYLTGNLAIGLEANSGIAGMLLNIERHGLGLDYVRRYPEIIGAVSLEAVREAARSFLDPDRAVVGVAGPVE